MAKKMSTGKVVALALCIIVGAGSIAALARGRDKDEEKEPAHVHDFTTSKICSCGEAHTISLSDVEVGTDLSGYSLRLTISEEEFEQKFYKQTDVDWWGLNVYGNDHDQFVFSEDGAPPFMQLDGLGFYVVDNSSGTPVEKYLFSAESKGGGFSSSEVYVFGSTFPAVVKSLSDFGDTVRDGIYSYLEFYYVGLEPTSAAYMRERAVPAEEVSDALDGANILLTDKNDGEFWTPFF